MWTAVRRLSRRDRKSTRLNSSHLGISYAVFCLKTTTITTSRRPRTAGSQVHPERISPSAGGAPNAIDSAVQELTKDRRVMSPARAIFFVDKPPKDDFKLSPKKGPDED